MPRRASLPGSILFIRNCNRAAATQPHDRRITFLNGRKEKESASVVLNVFATFSTFELLFRHSINIVVSTDCVVEHRSDGVLSGLLEPHSRSTTRDSFIIHCILFLAKLKILASRKTGEARVYASRSEPLTIRTLHHHEPMVLQHDSIRNASVHALTLKPLISAYD
jgi:hypothetical protein